MATKFSDIQQILESAVNGDTIGMHGNFWRGKTRDQFVQLKVFGQQLVHPSDGAGSNLVLALRGAAPFDGSTYPRMPNNYPPIADDQIVIISDWIDAGCPD